MPAKSKEQKQLMAWAYACKTGKTSNCPDNVRKLADTLSDKQFQDFLESNSNYMLEFNAEVGPSLANLDSVPGQGVAAAPIATSNGGNVIAGSGDVYDTIGIKKKRKKKKENKKEKKKSDDVEDKELSDIIKKQTEYNIAKQTGVYVEHLKTYEEFSKENSNI